jgi:hypothetical protein
VSGDGFLMVDLWWSGEFSWLLDGMFLGLKFFLRFEVYFVLVWKRADG